jgi:FimV-like protein
MFIHQDEGRLTGHPAVAAALALALAGAGVGSAVAAPGDAASAPDAASVSYTAGSQYTVRPGQSLNDVAIAVTQSHDRATLVRASRALFDANPNAFMGHDPSRMRVGAVLVVPALDASGALAASSAGAQGAAAASAPNAAVATDAVSGVAQVNAAAASAASAAAHAAAPAAPAVSGTASTAAEASSAAPGSTAVGAAASSAPAAGSQAAAASPVSGAHEWSGSIQAPASEPAAGGQTPAGTAPATTAAQSASQPRAQVSSLQQLLALKNRVLMELQKHGIGGAPVATSGTVSASAVQPVAGASSAAPAVSGHGAAAVVPASNSGNRGGLSQRDLSIAAAVGAALVVLLAALRMSRRKRERVASPEAASADGEVATSARASDPQDIAATRGQTAVPEASGADDGEALRHAAALAAAERAAAEQPASERAAAEQPESERATTEQAESDRATAEQAEAERTAAEQAAAERATAERAAQQVMAERAAAEHLPTTHEPRTDSPVQDPNPLQHDWQEHHASPAPLEPVQPTANALPPAESGFTSEPLPAAHQENFDSATTAASLAAAAELGAEALPLTPLEPVDEALQPEEPAHRLQWNDEPSPSASAAPQEPTTEPQNHLNTPPPVIDFTQQRMEPHTAPPFGQPYHDVSTEPLLETSAHAQPAPAAPTEFPRDAVDAFSSLDMPLPPRVESAADSIQAPASLTTQPVVSPETTAQQAFAPHEPDDTPHVADEIAAGTAGHAAVAGLGAAGFGAASFGALKLDFDLELPPSPAQPLPAFTQADLVRIARNKLDLASEYIELGDLSGARALINEVIEANDPATRTEARALLSTLAPLS